MEIKWIKITTNIFDDEKIQLIEAMPDSDTIIVIWFKLLALAGKCNSGGLVMFNEKIAFTNEMLVTLFRRKPAVIELALQIFQKFDMIEILDNQAILITNWEKHQNIEGMEMIREQNRIRKQNERERKRLMSRDGHTDVTQQNKKEELDKDIENKEKSGTNVPQEKVGESKVKHLRGIYKNVLLTDEEVSRLKEDFPNEKFPEVTGNEMIEYFSNALKMKNYNYKDHNLAIRKWVPRAIMEDRFRDNKIIKPKTTLEDDINKRVERMNEYLGGRP